MTTANDVVGVTMTFAPDGTPEGVSEVTRATALAARTAFELALAAEDPVLITRLLQELADAYPAETDPAAVTQQVCIVLLMSVVRPALQLLGPAADQLRETLRACADEFYVMEKS